ncbi:MAG: acyltransferase [Terracidiphilus sp.]|jgi:peptidoglycan/LPS O-acetylase OafA/YrhL
MSTTSVASTTPPASRSTPPSYNYALGYLKACIIALVVAHHASLAYHPAAPPIPASLLLPARWWQAYPVVDAHAAWAGVFATVNDIFFMTLMFFVSGLFVWRSLTRKGAGGYMRDRLLRIGLPFIPAALILAPLSYYPTYLQIPGHGGFGGFLYQWVRLGTWSAGPVWFLWVLLVFDFLAVCAYKVAPKWGESLGRITIAASQTPAIFFLCLVAVSALVYAPMTLAFGPFSWAAWGPFVFQKSRILLYFVYFVAGIAIGACGLDRGLLAPKGKLARRWHLWVAAAIVAFVAFAKVAAIVYSAPIPHTWREAVLSGPILLYLVLFTLSCAASSLASLAVCLRFLASRSRVLDDLAANSYGIFLTHYPFVSWLGLALLGFYLPAFAKFLLVTAGSIALSWLAVIALRRIPALARII